MEIKAVYLTAHCPEGYECLALRALLKKHGMTGAEAPGDIEWNFTKFLVDRSGNVVKRSGPKTTPAALAACIEALLSEK